MHVCVVGGGIIGMTTAYYLARDGHAVTVLESHERPGLGTSFANGGQLSYDYVAPLADAGVLRKLPQWLLDPESALRFVFQLEPAQWRWCLAFLAACNDRTSREVAAQLLTLASYSKALLAGMLQEENVAFQHARRGKLVIYRDAAAFEGAKRRMEYQAGLGSKQHALDARACADVEPALETLRSRLTGGIFTPSEEVGDCHALVNEIARVAASRYRVDLRFGATVEAFRQQGRRIIAAITNRGEDIEADAFVVAAGLGSKSLLHPLALELPLYPLTGYSVTLPIGEGPGAPKVSVTDAHYKIVYAAIGDRLRIAGMVDLTGLTPKPNEGRIAQLTRQARETFPNCGDFGRASTWCGHRPATPLSKPILDLAAPYTNLWLNTGHGGLGFTLACASGRLTADCVSGQRPSLELAPFTLRGVRARLP